MIPGYEISFNIKKQEGNIFNYIWDHFETKLERVINDRRII